MHSGAHRRRERVLEGDKVPGLVKELGANVNHANHNGSTPLYIAAEYEQVALMRCLVSELGAHVDFANNKGFAPVHTAAGSGRGHLKVIKFLVKELGADFNKASHKDSTPLYLTAACGH
jgi:ankyrin repeat protein